MPTVKAIILDLDGTLRDTKRIIYDAYNFTLQAHTKRRPTEAELLPYVHSHTEVHRAFALHIDRGLFEATYFGKIEELLPSAAPFFLAHETVQLFKEAGYKLAIVTSATFGADYLKRQNIHHLFDVIVDGKDTVQHKPHPEPVLKAVTALGTKASETVMIGDMTVDIQAAKSAKLAAIIGITHGFETREMLETAGADYIVDSFSELQVVIRKVTGHES